MTDLELFHHIAARTLPLRRTEARVLLLFWSESEGEALERRLARQGIRTIGIYSERQLRLYLAHTARRPNAAVELILASPNPEEMITAEDRARLTQLLPEVPELTPEGRNRSADAIVLEVLRSLAAKPQELLAV